VGAPPNRAPTVTARSTSVRAGASVLAATAITASDPDGDLIQRYEFRAPESDQLGWFTVGGQRQAAGSVFSVTAAGLGGVQYHAGNRNGTAAAQVRAFDGQAWSAWTSWSIRTTGARNTRPEIVGRDGEIVIGGSIAVADLFKASDPDGDVIERYEFRNGTRDAQSGYFTVAGVRQAAGSAFTVAAGQLGSVRFHAGTGEVTDQIRIRAYDGQIWSLAEQVSVATVASHKAPTVSATSRSVESGFALSLAAVVRAEAPQGKPILRYEFCDDTLGTTRGYVMVNGVQQPTRQVFSVSAADLHLVEFQTGRSLGTTDLRVRAFNGEAWSGWESFQVTTIASTNRAPELAAREPTVILGQRMAVSEMFEVRDPDGDAIVEYEIRDASSLSTRGYLTLDGQRLPSSQYLTVTPEEMARIEFVTGTRSGSDSIQIRAFDGRDWSTRQTVRVATVDSASALQAEPLAQPDGGSPDLVAAMVAVMAQTEASGLLSGSTASSPLSTGTASIGTALKEQVADSQGRYLVAA
jgi:hypothetical protein